MAAPKRARRKPAAKARRKKVAFACFACGRDIGAGQWMLVRSVRRLGQDAESDSLEVEDADSLEQLCPACAVRDGRLSEMQTKPAADDRCGTCGRARDGAARWMEWVESIDLVDADGDLWGAAERLLKSVCESCHPRQS